MSKELLSIIDKPIIQFAVEDAVEAGITDLVFVTGRMKRAIEDHFDGNAKLKAILVKRGKVALSEMIRNIVPKGVNCVFVRQTGMSFSAPNLRLETSPSRSCCQMT